MDGTLGQVIMFAGNFAPRNWAYCSGQLLAISQNSALFSILGTIYGGDGRTTFALPDLRGRSAIGVGNGPGLSSYREGQRGGVETVTLNLTEIPSHTHTAIPSGSSSSSLVRGAGKGTGGNFIADVAANFKPNGGGAPIEGLSVNGGFTVGNTGGSRAHENRSPFLAINFVICTQGLFPSRN